MGEAAKFSERALELFESRVEVHPTPCTLHPTPYTLHPTPYTPHSVFEVVCISQFPHKSVKLFFILVCVKDQLTDLWGS